MNKDKDLFYLNTIAQIIYDKKGVNILALDLRGVSSIAEYVILAEGMVDRHVIALAYAIKKGLQEVGLKTSHIEGDQTGEWVVLDYSTIMVHLFKPGLREVYQLEDLWKEAKIVDLAISLAETACT